MTKSRWFHRPSPRSTRPGLAAIAVLCLAASSVACSHSSEEDRLLGYWEGSLPAPATGEPLPISYDFRPNGLTVIVGIGPARTVTEWPRWEVHAEDQGDLIVHIYRDDQRAYATLVRSLDDGELMLWDIGTEEDTAAHVRRVAVPSEATPAEPPGQPSPTEPPPAETPSTRTLPRTPAPAPEGSGP